MVHAVLLAPLQVVSEHGQVHHLVCHHIGCFFLTFFFLTLSIIVSIAETGNLVTTLAHCIAFVTMNIV